MSLRPFMGWWLVCALLGPGIGSRCLGQAVDPAVVGERLQRLTAAVESLELTLASHRRQIDSLSAEVQELKEQASRQEGRRPWSEDLKRLSDGIAEVDRKRIADGEQTVKILTELRKAIGKFAESPAARPTSARQTNASGSATGGGRATKAAEPAADKALPYVMKRGQTISELLVEFNADAKKRGFQALSTDQVLEFNRIADARTVPEGATILFPLIPQ